MNLQHKKIAIVHDYLYTYGGAERVFEVFKELYPNGQVYTSYFLKDKFPEKYKDWNIKESWLGRIGLKKTFFRKFFTFFNFYSLRSLDLKEYDLIISSSTGPAKNIKFKKNSFHISYIHTPPWLAWGIIKPSSLAKKIYRPFLKKLDYTASKRPSFLLTNSKTTQERVRKFYGRDSQVIYPPVDVMNMINLLKNKKITKEDYFVMCSRLDLYKGISTVAKILDEAGIKMKIIGRSGPDLKNLKGLSENIEYLGAVSDEEKSEVIAKAKALIFWNVEDFGIVMVEALASGTPVIAFGEGGANEIITDGDTGIIFKEQSSKSLLNAITRFEKIKFNKEKLQNSSKRFTKEVFKQKIEDFIKKV